MNVITRLGISNRGWQGWTPKNQSLKYRIVKQIPSSWLAASSKRTPSVLHCFNISILIILALSPYSLSPANHISLGSISPFFMRDTTFYLGHSSFGSIQHFTMEWSPRERRSSCWVCSCDWRGSASRRRPHPERLEKRRVLRLHQPVGTDELSAQNWWTDGCQVQSFPSILTISHHHLGIIKTWPVLDKVSSLQVVPEIGQHCGFFAVFLTTAEALLNCTLFSFNVPSSFCCSGEASRYLGPGFRSCFRCIP